MWGTAAATREKKTQAYSETGRFLPKLIGNGLLCAHVRARRMEHHGATCCRAAPDTFMDEDFVISSFAPPELRLGLV